MSLIEKFELNKLINLIDKNQLSYDIFLANSSLIKLQKEKQFTLIESELDSSSFNGVINTGSLPETTLLDIKVLVERFKLTAPSFCWKIRPSTTSNILAETLSSLGLYKSSENSGMAVNLKNFESPCPFDEDLTIEQIISDEMFRLWISSALNGFGLSNELSEMYKRVLTDSGLNADIQYYLATYKGKPVATACCFFSDGVVGIYWVSTLPEYRRKGIGLHFMKTILHTAYKKGYCIAILQSSLKGLPMYEQLGFTEYCKNIRYEWNNLDN